MDDRELLWEQYNLNVDLYRSYLELVVKMNVFYYAVTGAIVSYYFTHATEPMVKWSLLLPLLMSVALGVFFLIGAWLARVPREETFKIRDALGLIAAPEIGVLIMLLIIVAVLMFVVAGGLVWVLCVK
jgi:uncharacterized membrane protein YeiH